MSAPCPTLGFTVRFRLANEMSASARAQFWSDFVAMVESRGLVCGGGGNASWEHTIWRDGSQAVDADRLALSAWCDARAEVRDVEVGDLIDLASVA